MSPHTRTLSSARLERGALASRACRVGPGACLLAGALACVDPKPGSHAAEPPPEQQIARLEIDTGESLELEPGGGLGVAVSYQGNGMWHLAASCDTAVTGSGCDFDIIARSGGGADLLIVEDAELEARDQAFFLDPFALELLLETGDDLDALTLSASPGAVLRLTVWFYDPVADSPFDWTRDPRIVSWVGHGAVHWGAPTNPLELAPTRP